MRIVLSEIISTYSYGNTRILKTRLIFTVSASANHFRQLGRMCNVGDCSEMIRIFSKVFVYALDYILISN